MQILFELSKEHPRISPDEIMACFEADKIPYTRVFSSSDVLILEAAITDQYLESLASRVALCFSISRVLGACTPHMEQLNSVLHTVTQPLQGSVAVTYRNRSQTMSSPPFIQAIAEHFTRHNPVDLQHPDNEIRVILTDDLLVIGLCHRHISRTSFEERKVQHRPFFSPISLHPKWARALVNLSRIKPSHTLLDPFCGTGGFLLEAGLLGTQVIGADIEQKMIDGCAATLHQYKITPKNLFCCDIGQLPSLVDKVDAVVTDFPYGRSTTTKGETIEQLSQRAFHSIHQMVKPHGYIVLGLHDKQLVSFAEDLFDLQTVYEQPVHRSLTRWFAVFVNKP